MAYARRVSILVETMYRTVVFSEVFCAVKLTSTRDPAVNQQFPPAPLRLWWCTHLHAKHLRGVECSAPPVSRWQVP